MLVVRPNAVRPSSSSSRPPPSHVLDSNPAHNTIITEDLSAEASVSTGSWNNHNNFAQNTVQWTVTTQPNFITRPKPSGWEKPTPTRNKVKPTKTRPQIFQQKPSSASSSSAYYEQSKPTNGYATRTTTTSAPVTTTTRRTTPSKRTTTTTTTTTSTTTQRPTSRTPTTTTTSPISKTPSAGSSPFSSDIGSSSAAAGPVQQQGKGELTISAARGLGMNLHGN